MSKVQEIEEVVKKDKKKTSKEKKFNNEKNRKSNNEIKKKKKENFINSMSCTKRALTGSFCFGALQGEGAIGFTTKREKTFEINKKVADFFTEKYEKQLEKLRKDDDVEPKDIEDGGIHVMSNIQFITGNSRGPFIFPNEEVIIHNFEEKLNCIDVVTKPLKNNEVGHKICSIKSCGKIDISEDYCIKYTKMGTIKKDETVIISIPVVIKDLSNEFSSLINVEKCDVHNVDISTEHTFIYMTAAANISNPKIKFQFAENINMSTKNGATINIGSGDCDIKLKESPSNPFACHILLAEDTSIEESGLFKATLSVPKNIHINLEGTKDFGLIQSPIGIQYIWFGVGKPPMLVKNSKIGKITLTEVCKIGGIKTTEKKRKHEDEEEESENKNEGENPKNKKPKKTTNEDILENVKKASSEIKKINSRKQSSSKRRKESSSEENSETSVSMSDISD